MNIPGPKMKYEDHNLNDLIGCMVCYTPPHTNKDMMHDDAEMGKITSVNEEYAFVCFGFDGTGPSKACRYEDLILFS